MSLENWAHSGTILQSIVVTLALGVAGVDVYFTSSRQDRFLKEATFKLEEKIRTDLRQNGLDKLRGVKSKDESKLLIRISKNLLRINQCVEFEMCDKNTANKLFCRDFRRYNEYISNRKRAFFIPSEWEKGIYEDWNIPALGSTTIPAQYKAAASYYVKNSIAESSRLILAPIDSVFGKDCTRRR